MQCSEVGEHSLRLGPSPSEKECMLRQKHSCNSVQEHQGPSVGDLGYLDLYTEASPYTGWVLIGSPILFLFIQIVYIVGEKWMYTTYRGLEIKYHSQGRNVQEE